MEYLVTAQEMKNCDKNTIEKFHMPSEVLMERAALSVVEEIQKALFCTNTVLVVCGSGNNGGDGFAIGRLLHLQGKKVQIFFAGNIEKMTKETRLQMEIAKCYGVTIATEFPKEDFSLVIDALFGIGMTRKIEKPYFATITKINALKNQGAKVVAVDIPSGIHTDTGKVMNIAVKADLTVSFAYRKLGTLLYPGADYCGKVVVGDIGITGDGFNGVMPKAITYDEKDLARLPKRENYGNKGTFGKLLVIAGSEGMSGAAYLCGKAAFRTGAGMVRIYTWEGNREVLQKILPEAMVTTYKEDDVAHTNLKKCLSWADIICLGPGLGQSKVSEVILEKVLTENQKPLVMDADGLNLVAKNKIDLSEKAFPVVVTPHLGEMARLTGQEIGYIKDNVVKFAVEYAKANKVTCVLKDARTIVAWGSEDFYVNSSGNHGMATAGSGDVLAGIIAGLLGQGLDAIEGARLGVFLHGVAGERAGEALGKPALMASDIIDFIGNEGRKE